MATTKESPRVTPKKNLRSQAEISNAQAVNMGGIYGKEPVTDYSNVATGNPSATGEYTVNTGTESAPNMRVGVAGSDAVLVRGDDGKMVYMSRRDAANKGLYNGSTAGFNALYNQSATTADYTPAELQMYANDTTGYVPEEVKKSSGDMMKSQFGGGIDMSGVPASPEPTGDAELDAANQKSYDDQVRAWAQFQAYNQYNKLQNKQFSINSQNQAKATIGTAETAAATTPATTQEPVIPTEANAAAQREKYGTGTDTISDVKGTGEAKQDQYWQPNTDGTPGGKWVGGEAKTPEQIKEDQETAIKDSEKAALSNSLTSRLESYTTDAIDSTPPEMLPLKNSAEYTTDWIAQMLAGGATQTLLDTRAELKEQSTLINATAALSKATALEGLKANKSLISMKEEAAQEANDLAAEVALSNHEEQVRVAKRNNARLEGYLKGKFAANGMDDGTTGLYALAQYMGEAEINLANIEKQGDFMQRDYASQHTQILNSFAQMSFDAQNAYNDTVAKISSDSTAQLIDVSKSKILSQEKYNSSMGEILSTMATRQETAKHNLFLENQAIRQYNLDIAKNAQDFWLETSRLSQSETQFEWQKEYQTKMLNKGSYQYIQPTTTYDEFGTPTEGSPMVFNQSTGGLSYSNATGQVSNIQPGQTTQEMQDLSKMIGTYSKTRGECGAFVNDYFGKKLFADDYNQKKSLINSDTPVVGGAFIMPLSDPKYAPYGHVGIVKSINPDGTITAIDSNFVAEHTVGEHKISMNSIDGYYVPGGKAMQAIISGNTPEGTPASVLSAVDAAKDVLGKVSIPDSRLSDIQSKIDQFVNPEIDTYADVINEGKAISSIPKEMRGAASKLAKLKDQYNNTLYESANIPYGLQNMIKRASGMDEKTVSLNQFNKNVESYIQSGDTNGLRQYVEGELVNGTKSSAMRKTYGDTSMVADEMVSVTSELSTLIEEAAANMGMYGKIGGDINKWMNQSQNISRINFLNKALAATANYTHELVGANYTSTEAARYSSLFVSGEDTAQDVAVKLNSLKHSMIISKYNSLDKLTGGVDTPYYIAQAMGEAYGISDTAVNFIKNLPDKRSAQVAAGAIANAYKEAIDTGQNVTDDLINKYLPAKSK